MKKITYLLISATVILLTSCSKKDNEQVTQPQVSEQPQSRYGKAIKQTEDLTQQIEQDRKTNEALFEE